MMVRNFVAIVVLLSLCGCVAPVSSPSAPSTRSSAAPGAPEEIHYHYPTGEAASFGYPAIVEQGDPAPKRDSVGINELQPTEVAPSPSPSTTMTPPEATAKPLVVPPSDSGVYMVKPGDTVFSIARQHNVTPADLIRLNDLQAPYGLQLGQTLKIPGGAAGQATPKSLLPKVDNRGFPSPEASKALPPFLAPVSAGRLVDDFGRRGMGEVNHGIRILAPRGTPIRAAGSGTVLYVGQNVPNLGRLVLLRHDRQWVTAYAHADKILVKKGQKITKGDIIALVGDSGGVATPQLQFQVRQGSKPVDPFQYIHYHGSAFREAGLQRQRAL